MSLWEESFKLFFPEKNRMIIEKPNGAILSWFRRRLVGKIECSWRYYRFWAQCGNVAFFFVRKKIRFSLEKNLGLNFFFFFLKAETNNLHSFGKARQTVKSLMFSRGKKRDRNNEYSWASVGRKTIGFRKN